MNHAINGPPPPCRCPSRASRSRRSARSALSPLDELINSLVVDVLYGEVEDGEPRRGVLRFWGKPQCPTRLRCAPTTWRTPRRPSHRASRSVEPLGLRHIVHRKAAKCLGVLERMSVCFAASHSSVCVCSTFKSPGTAAGCSQAQPDPLTPSGCGVSASMKDPLPVASQDRQHCRWDPADTESRRPLSPSTLPAGHRRSRGRGRSPDRPTPLSEVRTGAPRSPSCR